MSTKKYEFTAQDIIERILSDKEFRNELLTLLAAVVDLADRIRLSKEVRQWKQWECFFIPCVRGNTCSSNRRIRSFVGEVLRGTTARNNGNRGKATTQAIIQVCKGMGSENKRINSYWQILSLNNQGDRKQPPPLFYSVRFVSFDVATIHKIKKRRVWEETGCTKLYKFDTVKKQR